MYSSWNEKIKMCFDLIIFLCNIKVVFNLNWFKQITDDFFMNLKNKQKKLKISVKSNHNTLKTFILLFFIGPYSFFNSLNYILLYALFWFSWI